MLKCAGRRRRGLLMTKEHSIPLLRDPERTWCIYGRLTREEKDTVNKIVYDCLERNGFDPEDPWWEMNYLLASEDLFITNC